jgi:hypothetical protein
VSHEVLVAISAGAVFMGANTYIGNGPNFMVRAIAEERGVRMPTLRTQMRSILDKTGTDRQADLARISHSG